MIRGAFAAMLVLALAGCSGVTDFFRGYGKARSDALAGYDLAALDAPTRGAIQFAVGDFGALDTDALETHAIPWRLAGAALVRAEHDVSGAPLNAETLGTVLRRFGFLYPERIGNWPQGAAPPRFDAPLGLNLGTIRRSVPQVELAVANLGCASCHAGVTYDADGAPRPDVAWLGAPNTSLDLEAYVQAVYRAFLVYGDKPDLLLETVRAVFPDATAAELATLRSFVMPRVKARMAAIAKAGGGPLPFVNGMPGLTNGVAALKMQFGLLGADAHGAERGFTAIPDLGARGWRTSLLYDGAYAAPGVTDRVMTAADVTPAHLDGLAVVTAFFTVPSMGVHPDKVAAHLGEAKDVFRFFATYAPPRWPGRIDRAKATRGQALYAAQCASCHGAYDASLDRPELQSFPNWLGAYDTDPARAAAFTPETAAAVNASAYRSRIVARSTGQYAAPPLAGVWMSAPYLHNGSVPTLRALLTPSSRPERFSVGGHRLDMAAVGVAQDARHTPFATPAVIDTRAPGLSNRGHESEFDVLSPRQRDDLIEYLKLL
jgi:mono/diheme cytochrome c family protein